MALIIPTQQRRPSSQPDGPALQVHRFHVSVGQQLSLPLSVQCQSRCASISRAKNPSHTDHAVMDLCA